MKRTLSTLLLAGLVYMSNPSPVNAVTHDGARSIWGGKSYQSEIENSTLGRVYLQAREKFNGTLLTITSDRKSELKDFAVFLLSYDLAINVDYLARENGLATCCQRTELQDVSAYCQAEVTPEYPIQHCIDGQLRMWIERNDRGGRGHFTLE